MQGYDNTTTSEHKNLLRNMLFLMIGTASSQLITLGFAPLLTRLYGPEAFGLLGTFISITGALGPAIALSYPLAIVLSESRREAAALAYLSLIISSVTICLVAASFWFSRSWIIDMLGISFDTSYLLLVPIALICASCSQVATQWLIREQAFLTITKANIYQSLFVNIAQAAAGLFHPIGTVLIAISTTGQAVLTALLLRGVGKQAHGKSKAIIIPKQEVLRAARAYSDFPAFRAPQNLINSMSVHLPVLLFATFLGPQAAGHYILARLVIGVPTNLAGKAIGEAYYPWITKASQNDGNIQVLLKRDTAILILLGTIPLGVLIFYGPYLFSGVFGVQWATAGEYSRWLAVFYFFNFINRPCVAAIPALKLQKGLLHYELVSTSCKLLVLLFGVIWLENGIHSVAMYAAVGALCYTSLIAWVLHHAGASNSICTSR